MIISYGNIGGHEFDIYGNSGSDEVNKLIEFMKSGRICGNSGSNKVKRYGNNVCK